MLGAFTNYDAYAAVCRLYTAPRASCLRDDETDALFCLVSLMLPAAQPKTMASADAENYARAERHERRFLRAMMSIRSIV